MSILRRAATTLTLIVPSILWSQTTPFLTDDEIRMLSNEISGDRAFEHIRVLSRWHRDSGMEGYFQAAEYVVAAAREAGLEDVKFVEQPLSGPNYTAKSAELWMVEPVEVKLADIGDHATHLADGSHDADVTAELVWIGNGSKEDVGSLDVAGKIVLTSGSPSAALFNAVYEKGAVGIVTSQTAEGRNPVDAGDQIAWTRIPVTPPEGKKGSFAFTVTPRMGEALRAILASKSEMNILASGKKAMGGRIVLKARVDTEIGPSPGRTGFVEGWIHGTKPDQQIVLTAHLQEEQGSANDDGSGCGNLLELARVFNKLIKEGKLARPERSLRFWWTDEIYSEYRTWQDHPDEPKKILVNIHQDMTGANQAMGSRVQHLIFAPHSRTSFLDALFESVGTYVILTNNAFLAASRQGGLPRPFTRPMFATRGTRQNYSARFVPYFGSSDHMTFLDGPVGIPSVAMINWDDDYIHSSQDDLFQIDPTQLKRNNFIIGAMAFTLAGAKPADVPVFAAEIYAQALGRLANDLRVASELINSSGESGWKDAFMMIEQGIQRDVRAMISLRALAAGDRKSLETINRFIVRIKERESIMIDDLKVLYRQVTGREPSAVRMDSAELAASKKVPVNHPALGDYFANRQKIGFRAGGRLHGLMRSEVYNFVDGTRSYFDIYKAVRAEALAAGSWYYGTVTLEDVVALLDKGVETGAWTLR